MKVTKEYLKQLKATVEKDDSNKVETESGFLLEEKLINISKIETCGRCESKIATLNDKIYKQEGEKLVEVVDDPQAKPTSLVNLISRKDVTVDGITYPANQRFAFDENTQQDLIKLARDQGAFVAPTKIEEVKAPTVDTTEVDNVVKELEDTTTNTSLNLDVGTAAGGDIPGVVTDLANTVFGAFTGTFSPDRSKQVAVINEANNRNILQKKKV